MTTKNAIVDWLEAKFLEWRATQGRRAGMKQFAQHLGVSRSTLNSWMSRGVEPDSRSLGRLSSLLGTDIYHLVGRQPADPLMQHLLNVYHRLPDSAKERLLQYADELNSETPAAETASAKRTRATKTKVNHAGRKQ